VALTAEAKPRTKRAALLFLGAAAVLAFFAVRSLGESTVFFKTADEAVRDKQELGTHRFRIEGTVLAGSVREADDRTRFTIAEKGAQVAVVHDGAPPDLFQPGIPVVLEGRWAGDHFASDRIMVKHTEQYKAKHPDRVQK
jgi:cytochrome c-type biogenesis protein CcmE